MTCMTVPQNGCGRNNVENKSQTVRTLCCFAIEFRFSLTVRPMFRKDVWIHAPKRSSKATKLVKGIAFALVIVAIN